MSEKKSAIEHIKHDFYVPITLSFIYKKAFSILLSLYSFKISIKYNWKKHIKNLGLWQLPLPRNGA